METIPFIITNYKYILIAYGYYSAIKSGINGYNTGVWIYDTTRNIYRVVKPTGNKNNQWELLENITIIDPKCSKIFILRDNTEKDFTLIEKL